VTDRQTHRQTPHGGIYRAMQSVTPVKRERDSEQLSPGAIEHNFRLLRLMYVHESTNNGLQLCGDPTAIQTRYKKKKKKEEEEEEEEKKKFICRNQHNITVKYMYRNTRRATREAKAHQMLAD